MRAAILLAASAAALALYVAVSDPAPAEPAVSRAGTEPTGVTQAQAPATGSSSVRPAWLARRAEVASALASSGPALLRTGRLQEWWRTGQAHCADLGIGDCRHWLLATIASWPDPRAKGIAQRAVERLDAVSGAQSRLVQEMSTPLSQRLQRLVALREATMGREEAQAWFGREQAHIGFTAAVNEFAAGDAARMPMASRLARVEALRAYHYGALHEELKAAEGPVTQYRIALGLAMLDAGDAHAAALLRERLRTQYFPAEQAMQIAQLERRADSQQAQQHRYVQALADLQRLYPDQANHDYLSRLAALRQQYFP